MMTLKTRITWGMFLLFSFIILALNKAITKEMIFNLKRELKALGKKHSRYADDGSPELKTLYKNG